MLQILKGYYVTRELALGSDEFSQRFYTNRGQERVRVTTSQCNHADQFFAFCNFAAEMFIAKGFGLPDRMVDLGQVSVDPRSFRYDL